MLHGLGVNWPLRRSHIPRRWPVDMFRFRQLVSMGRLRGRSALFWNDLARFFIGRIRAHPAISLVLTALSSDLVELVRCRLIGGRCVSFQVEMLSFPLIERNEGILFHIG